MKRLAMLVCLVLVPLLAAPASVEAFRGIPGGRWWKDPDIQQQVGLSPEQIEQVKALYASHQPKMVDLRAQMRKRQLELEELLEAGSPEEAALSTKIDEVVAARASLDKERLTTLAKVRGLLTAEQYAKLRTIQREFSQTRRGHHRRSRGGGGGPVTGDDNSAGPGL